MPGSEKTHHFGFIITIIIIGLLALALGVLLYNMLVGKESYESAGEKRTAADILCCNYNRELETIFSTDGISSLEHKIKITFMDDKPDDIMYTLSGEFQTDAADSEGRLWHTEYNLYMSNHNLKIDDLENHFSLSENKAWANLYAKFSSLNSVTASLFFITPEELSSLENAKMTSFAGVYRSLGFKCTLNQSTKE